MEMGGKMRSGLICMLYIEILEARREQGLLRKRPNTAKSYFLTIHWNSPCDLVSMRVSWNRKWTNLRLSMRPTRLFFWG
jgi:hypothetical protein